MKRDYTTKKLLLLIAVTYYGLGVDSASNRNEYQVYFLGIKAAGA
jgi:hypothetical protein